MIKDIKLTQQDLKAGFVRWELWTALGWNEIRQKYRRSAIGPLWAMLNFAVFTVVMGFLYSELLGRPIEIYLPHLMLGLMVWNLVSKMVLEGCHLFTKMRPFILESKNPMTTYVLFLLWKNMILFGFSFVIFIIAVVVIPLPLTLSWMKGLAGLVLVLINALWMGLFIAVVAARYHDLVELIGVAFRLLFFVTPIIWMPGMAGRAQIILDVNPFYHMIEIFRAYFVGSAASDTSWLFSIVMAIVGWLITALFYGKYRNRIAFWV